MDVGQQPQQPAQLNILDADHNVDLVGGPFAVIESDPGVFTSLTRKLGVHSIELIELYDIEPWAVDHLRPHGLIFCFLWRKDAHRPADFDDPAADRVWFANQLSDDACASHALLNVLLNCPSIDIGDDLRRFRHDTEKMSPVMKGLAITNDPLLRKAHNSLARPADIRGSLNAIALTTLKASATAAAASTSTPSTSKPTSKRSTKPPPSKRAKTTAKQRRDRDRDRDWGPGDDSDSSPAKKPTKPKPKAAPPDTTEDNPDTDEAFHFIGYVPAYGKVWELDGLKSGPLEVGELSLPSHPTSTASDTASAWMDIARPALRMKMAKYGGDNIRFSLLAVVDGVYEHASDTLQLLIRERAGLERRMGDRTAWEDKVDPALLHTPAPHSTRLYAPGIGERRQEMDKRVLDLPEAELIPAWEACVKATVAARVAVEDEVARGVQANTEHIKRTFDYEPFLTTFVERLQADGLLNGLLGLDEDGVKIKVKNGKPTAGLKR